jgi:hypothetical protein
MSKSMTEQQYIDTTNLAKVRIAVTVVRDTLAMNSDEEAYRSTALRSLLDWQEKLEALVRTQL